MTVRNIIYIYIFAHRGGRVRVTVRNNIYIYIYTDRGGRVRVNVRKKRARDGTREGGRRRGGVSCRGVVPR